MNGPKIPPKSLTGDDALRLLAEQVEKKGADHVYLSVDGKPGPKSTHACYNLHRTADGQSWEPACIVAQVFAALGYEPDDTWVTGAAYTTNGRARTPFNDEGADTLARAQASQDRGETWGQALTYARERLEARRKMLTPEVKTAA